MLQEKLLDFALMGAGWVLWLLVGLSVLCLAVAVERAIYRLINSTPMLKLQPTLARFFTSGRPEELLAAMKSMKGVEARVLSAGLEAALEGGAEAAEETIAGTMVFERLKLERGLIVLGTTGSNAPFIGLFGTVLGIIKAFHDLSLDADSAGAVMAGISEALVATAIGLMVAIPAVVLFNWFKRMNKTQMDTLQSLSHLMLGKLKGEEVRPEQTAAPAQAAEARSA